MRRIIIAFLLFSATNAKAQETPPPTAPEIKLPVVVPGSPEASAIAMNGQLSVGMVSGGAQASIPLYEIKVGNLSVPIALNYASTGMKIDETPSRVGMNWILSPSGVVTRIVNGKADDQSTRYQPYSGFPYYQNSLYDIAAELSSAMSSPAGGNDMAADEFRYSAPGISGKFIIKDDGSILQIPYTNNKIQVVGGPWGGGGAFSSIIVISPDGIKYTFGGSGAIENTYTIQNGQYVGSTHNIRTGFFLKKIQNLQGDSVEFSYSPKTFTVTTGKSNSLTQVISQTGNTCTSTSCIPNNVTFKESLSTIGYQSVYLSNITGSNGIGVSFEYEERPDNSDDVRFKTFTVNAGNLSKSFYFKYDFYATSAFYLGRYYLKEVGYTLPISGSNPPANDSIRYTLSYDSPELVAPRLSYSQDHWGYYNGQNNTSYLIPYPDQVTGNYSSANRNPYFYFASKGMLKKITFPTGGYQEFEYEGNSTSSFNTTHSYITARALGSGDNTPTQDTTGSGIFLTYYSDTFTPPTNQAVNLTFSTFQNQGCSCGPDYQNVMTLATFEVRDQQTNSVVQNGIARLYGTENFLVYLQENRTYKIKLTVRGFRSAARAELTYDATTSSQTYYVDNPSPGVRVKRVGTYEPLTQKLTNKYYKYGKIESPWRSTGLFMMAPVYWYDFSTLTPCGDINHPTIGCINRFVSSVPQNNLFIFDGNAGGYSTVIEADDTSFAHGGIEHNFLTVGDNELPTAYYNTNYILTTPRNTKTFLQNLELKTNIFNNQGLIVKSTSNSYRVDTSVNYQYKAWTCRQRINHILVGLPSADPYYNINFFGYCYDLNSFDYISNWIKLDSTQEIQYSENGVAFSTLTLYNYGSPSNTLPSSTTTLTSKGEQLSLESKYPTDYTGGVYSKLVTNNLLNIPIENNVKKNGILLSSTRNEYLDWYPALSYVIISPQKVFTTKQSNSEELRMQYYSYDENQNVRELAKDKDVRISYIWDYNKEFPVAEFQNASITSDSLAYTSFETNFRGGWNAPNGGIILGINPPTGDICYNLDIGGSITKTIIPSKNYYVSYWLKDGSGSANVNSTSSVQVTNKNGWTCYRHSISGSSLIIISGTGTIDELRLYPQSALLKTITYKPFFGVSSECDINNRITYYEYDNEARLALVRDADRNILKKICYKLATQTVDCPVDLSSSATWSPSGQTRCRLCAANPIYQSSISEREEIDLNPASPTYNIHRWVVYSGNCVAPADWVNTGSSYCQKNEYDENNGYNVIIQRDMNPCSSTYNTTRQSIIYNTSSCPVCAPVCNHPFQKCINGVCVTGTWAVIAVTQIGKDQWECSYAYCFPDGSISGYRQNVTSSQACSITCGGPTD